jgi:cytidylate kinase
MIIAVDGPVAAGKGTLARRLAQHFDLAYLDTGSLYRAVAARLLREGGDPEDADAARRVAETLTEADLAATDLRAERTGAAASVVAAMPAVRAALLAYQRQYATHPPGGAVGAVLDGRDIGTVVCPDADVKLFVTASAEERARRRWQELKDRGDAAAFETVLDDLRQRDARDQARDTAPLKPADDAHLLDTTNLGIEPAFEAAKAIVARHFARA